jgi:hypothetical protein
VGKLYLNKQRACVIESENKVNRPSILYWVVGGLGECQKGRGLKEAKISFMILPSFILLKLIFIKDYFPLVFKQMNNKLKFN